MKQLFSIITFLFLVVAESSALSRNEQVWQNHADKMGLALKNFINEAENCNMRVNSILVIQHGKLLAESRADGQSAETAVDQGEMSSTIAAIAIGLAVEEGLLKVDDKVISFFPDKLPTLPSEKLKDMTVGNLLTMTTGHEQNLSFDEGTDWVYEFLSQPVPYKPGTYFCYERMAGYMLSAILQRVSGEKLIDFLRPRLFEPLGILSAKWKDSPQGINTGGWGLQVTTQDMARIGIILLNEGEWNGKRIVPKKWIKQMMRYQTESCPREIPFKNIVQSGLYDYENDWIQGFGYQMWHSRLQEFVRAEDNRGKLLLVMPKYDAVVAIDMESKDVQTELNLAFHHISPALPEWRGKKEKRYRTDTTPHLHRM